MEQQHKRDEPKESNQARVAKGNHTPEDELLGAASPLELKALDLARQHARVELRVIAGGIDVTRWVGDYRAIFTRAVTYFRGTDVQKVALSVAAEWILDNDYILKQSIRQLMEDLPSSYYHELPKLELPETDDLHIERFAPRLFEIARVIIQHDDARLSIERVERFLQAYQQVSPLRIGEVWAVPSMLRLGILEVLSDRLVQLIPQVPGFKEHPRLIKMPEQISDDDLIANCISSLRVLNNQDWSEFFEILNRVEQILREDPAEVYAAMDFESRDRYRKVIEEISHQSDQSEWQVASDVVSEAEAALSGARRRSFAEGIGEGVNLRSNDGRSGFQLPPQAHVGYYLLGDGRVTIEGKYRLRSLPSQRVYRWALANPVLVYLGSVFVISAAFLGALLYLAIASQGTFWVLLPVFLLGLVPALSLGVSLVNTIITHILPPSRLPRMDFSLGSPLGIPPDAATLVVIPALLTTNREVDLLLQQIELHFLRNPSENLYFSLLTDFGDAPSKEMPEDAALLERAAAGIERLNSRYSRRGVSPFYLFHRERRWNELENAWIGWERKRGKLHELNRLILGDEIFRFQRTVGSLEFLSQVRYVITLDVDTVLPSGAAAELVATLFHPLNRAVFGKNDRVISGYTVLQPRTEILWSRAYHSLFTRAYVGDRGIDLYTRAVSDVYQDLFGEGIYIGKGIYDVAAFERSLENRVPENALLSHDLFEGIQGRAGLVTDVAIIEDYPPNYLVAVHRMHRWVRGDWQLLPWLLPRVPSPGGGKIRNPLRLIDRWKVLDNLRRSLLAPALLAFWIASWLFFPGSPLAWMLAGSLVYSIPTLTVLINGLRNVVASRSARSTTNELWLSLLRWLLALVFLPYEALVNLDAITTTLVRLFFDRRRLLQWTTAADVTRNVGLFLKPHVTWVQMGAAFILGLALIVAVTAINASALWVAAPVSLIWMLSPQIAYWISLPLGREEPPLTSEENMVLRTLARRTWFFFEQFSGPEDHWLPPDHFQESPRGVIAHRTSPTNIGFGLMSTLAAWDLGYIELVDFVTRTRATFDSLGKMERYRGHFFNWYDTLTLKPLQPRYISTVDSGNLAAALIAVREGCLALREQPLLRSESWQGFADEIALISGLVRSWESQPAREDHESLFEYLDGFYKFFQQVADKNNAWFGALLGLEEQALSAKGNFTLRELYRLLMEYVEKNAERISPDRVHQLRVYAQQLQRRKESLDRQFGMLVPWIQSISNPPGAIRRVFQEESLSNLARQFINTPPTAVRLNEVDSYLSGAQELQAGAYNRLQQYNLDSLELRQALSWLDEMVSAVESAAVSARILDIGLQELVNQVDDFVREMDFSFLFDPQRQVFHIGYNLESDRLDDNHYDLLASEARIASFIAIAKRDVPQSHWLHLSRPVTQVNGSLILLSWSATMFEYLFPPLLMRSYPGTLLNSSMRNAVVAHIQYASRRGVPWGISESGYYHFDNNQNYQYRAFGIPGLGFKRGLENDLVVTPHASLMALPLRPKAVYENYLHLARLGMLGTYGLFEAVDFTQERLPAGEKYAIVRSYMSHHQGMLFLGLVNYIKNGIMVRRFHNNPMVRSMELILQEQVPLDAPVETPHIADQRAIPLPNRPVTTRPWKMRIRTPQPRPLLLSNGRLTVMVTNSGGGFTRWRDTDVTRWRPDTTLDNWGTWVYLQELEDLNQGIGDKDKPRASAARRKANERSYWSATHQPGGKDAASAEVVVYPARVEFRRKDGYISTQTEIAVAREEDVEIRRITLTNHSNRTRRLRVTSFAEISLAPQATDERHPAFNKLFIESSALPELQALLFKRRPRRASEEPVIAAHALVLEAGEGEGFEYETDRAVFLGRGNTARNPVAICGLGQRSLSANTGSTLDPAACLSTVVELPPHGQARLAFLTLAGDSEPALIATLKRFRRWYTIQRAFDQARSSAELELRQAGLTGNDVQAFQRLLSVLLYPHRALRAGAKVLAENYQGQSGLWGFSISGDYPILLVRLYSADDLSLAREALQAYAYWRARQVKVDLVFLNSEAASYSQALNDQLYRLIRSLKLEAWLNRRGGIFLLYADQMAEQASVLLHTVARAVLDGRQGSLAEQVRQLRAAPVRLPRFVPVSEGRAVTPATPPVRRLAELQFYNGVGGFTPDGREYVIYLPNGAHTPLPWANVIAYPHFGFLVTEAGSAVTWALNSGENRLTPWSNDPVSDPTGEAIYIRDEETAEFWSPTPQPVPTGMPYRIHHGAGYTDFYHNSHGLKQRVRMFASPEDPVKIVRLRVENLLDRTRRITVTYYAEWILGTKRSDTQPYIVTEYDDDTQALLAHNRYNQEFSEQVAFAAASKTLHGLTADRTEFLGRMGDIRNPAGIRRIGLAGEVTPGVDPCAALQLHLDIPPGGSEEVHFLLGQGQDRDTSLRLISRYQDAQVVAAVWERVGQFWDEILGGLTVETPDPAFNLLLNRWLLYQALSCRIWGRSAFYQSSGAYGYRDQLQDVLSVLLTKPEIAREHILRAAAHQFEAGDVLHWWHPPSGRGVRTRISDDLVWLPYVTCAYVEKTGDLSILDDRIPFKRGEPLQPDEEERYGHYASTTESASLFEHCRRALQRGLTSGPHGLPLIGTGDWNDGMNRVGAEGRGESVWLGWFLEITLRRFASVCTLTGRQEQAELYRQQAAALVQAIEEHAWDGEWYRRAYFDDGSPLGSVHNIECQIDSIAQSWAVLSGSGDPGRARQAMQAVSDRLVREEDALILLFTPPFDRMVRDPGYIRGYVPGIRENGGQYTHAAIWAVWAFAELAGGSSTAGDPAGDTGGDEVWRLFNLINPIRHADQPEKMLEYKVEPYVIAADVYGRPPHTGRGGWTWYTGSSGWMYSLGIEALLGLHKRGDRLLLDPCIPSSWNSYQVHYRVGDCQLHIQVQNPYGVSKGVSSIRMDGIECKDLAIPLNCPAGNHQVIVILAGENAGQD